MKVQEEEEEEEGDEEGKKEKEKSKERKRRVRRKRIKEEQRKEQEADAVMRWGKVGGGEEKRWKTGLDPTPSLRRSSLGRPMVAVRSSL